MRLLVALLGPSLLLATAACAADWNKVAEIDGILIERRMVPRQGVPGPRRDAERPRREDHHLNAETRDSNATFSPLGHDSYTLSSPIDQLRI